MKSQKGQSAIEYLTTYGWMLLVVAIVGGAIFTTVQNSSQIKSVSGLNNADVQVSDYGLNNEGLQLSLRAAAADQVNINKVEIKDPETGITAEISPSKVVSVGGKTQIQMRDVQKTETSDNYNLKINYDTGGLEGLTAEGTIRGSLGVFNRISIKSSKFNRSINKLQIEVKNTGDNTTDSIGYTLEANRTDYTGSLPNLAPSEETQINISTDETYPLKSVDLDTEGYRFLNSNSDLKCTPTKGLVGYWTFNNEQTKNGWAKDLSGHQNNGSLKGGIEAGAEGTVGESYRFDGDDDFVEVMESPELNITSNLTIFGYMNPSEIPFSNYGGLLEKRRNDPSKGGYALLTAKGTNKVRYEVVDEFGAKNFDSKSNLSEGEWYSTSLVSNETNMKGFLNSDKQGNEEPSIDSSSGTNLKIGSRTIGSGRFNGSIDEVRIYNRSLSQSEIQRLHNVRSEDWAVSGCKLTG